MKAHLKTVGQETERSGARIGPIDSLRCFAMSAVVAQHCGLLPFGWTGVWLFFVISGYVVTMSVIGRDIRRSGLPGLVRFFRRRAVRILPVYLAYVVAGLFVVAALGGPIDGIAALSLFGFLNNIAMIFGRGELAGWPVGHLWTISVEMQFYLVFGVVLSFCSRRTVVAMLVAALLLSPVLRAGASVWLSQSGWEAGAIAYAIYAGPFLHSDAFAAGALLALATQVGCLGRVARPLALLGLAVLAAYGTTYAWVNYAVLGRDGLDVVRDVVSGTLFGQGREVLLYSALAAASVGLVALAAERDTWLDWLLRNPVLQRIGAISYGAYVYHGLAIMLVLLALDQVIEPTAEHPTLPVRLAVFVLSYGLTIGTAELSFRTLEQWVPTGRGPRAPQRSASLTGGGSL